MQYIEFGKTGHKVSRFGLGCMRFPDSESEAIEMVRYAIDNGVNYLDSAYMYEDSEEITGRALKNGYRDKTYIATKSPLYAIEKYEDFENYLDKQLIRWGIDYIDFYLLHNLSYENWELVKRLDGFTFLDKMIQKGKIRHKGFSIHSTLPAFKEAVDAADWDMVQIQLNILDEFQQVGVEGLKYAAGKSIPVVIMEPLRGGYMLNNIPSEVGSLIDKYPEKRSLIEWCFRWLYSMPETSVILSGTSTLSQLKMNLQIFSEANYNVMSESDLELIRSIRAAYDAQNSIHCTGCRYCMPCPQNVSIPDIFRLYNNYTQMKDHWVDRGMYSTNIVPMGMGANQCIECGVCTTRCPQRIDIPGKLKEVHKELSWE